MIKQERVEVQLTIAAPVERLFQALTDSGELQQWFAEAANVSFSEQRYHFWGRYTPETPGPTEPGQTLLEARPNHRLSYRWPLHGRDTLVVINLEVAEQGTTVRLQHQGVRPHQPQNYIMADFWSLALENLRGWIEQGRIGIQCDFSEIQTGDAVRLDLEIEAASEAVFGALIKPEALNRYIAQQATVEAQVGGVYSYGWEDGPVKILDLVPNEKLSLHWEYDQEPETVLTWTLVGSGGKTHLTLVHNGFGPTRRNDDYQVGWAHFINRLKFMLEVGPAWQRPEFLTIDYA